MSEAHSLFLFTGVQYVSIQEGQRHVVLKYAILLKSRIMDVMHFWFLTLLGGQVRALFEKLSIVSARGKFWA